MLLAILLPGLSLLLNRRPVWGILFLLLQPTGVGWIVGILVAEHNLEQKRTQRPLRIQ